MTKAGFGEHLKREREMRGVSLDEICTATRIATRFLEAMENEEWERLPGGVFNRGFVRAVARYLGLDEDGLVAEYILSMSERSGTPTSAWTNQQPQQLAGPWPANPDVNWPLRVGLLLLAALLFAGAGWLSWRWYTAQRAQTAARRAAASSPAAEAGGSTVTSGPGALPGTTPGTTPGPTSGSAPKSSRTSAAASAPAAATSAAATPANGAANSAANNPASNPTKGGSSGPASGAPAAAPAAITGLQLKVDADRGTNVTVAADGKQVFRAIIPAGQSRTFSARNRIEIRAQDAGAVSLELNGQTIAPIGRPGRPGRIALTRRDVKSAGGGLD
jgi:cytoskeleton protein RodZ